MKLFLNEDQAEQLKPYKELMATLVRQGEIIIHQTETTLGFTIGKTDMVLTTGFEGLINYLEMLNDPEFTKKLLENSLKDLEKYNISSEQAFKELGINLNTKLHDILKKFEL